MTTLDALEALQALFADPARHTRLHPARDAYGEPVCALSLDATCWCVVGGCYKVTGWDDDLADQMLDALKRSTWKLFCCGLVSTSDHLGLESLRTAIADAIATERAGVPNT